ncbi:hypothetical protein ANCCAN_10304 [Ancylostoma caninum]|uniref:Uncharacterized protein n=1 Tax=Ancylostoma caninum TaxID=29170 RepID=A0A368GKF7_ANCCA|nr:hypothetical protein ANCCAN_10304 [Ancylostoma caninum]
MLLVQAVEIRNKEESKHVWQDPNLESRDMQTIRLELGTTVLGVDRALGFDDNSKEKSYVFDIQNVIVCQFLMQSVPCASHHSAARASSSLSAPASPAFQHELNQWGQFVNDA